MPETQASREMAAVLTRIVGTKRGEVQGLLPLQERLEEEAGLAPQPLDFLHALVRAPEVGVIAEIKRRSPGAGPIRPALDPASVARGYGERGGAAVSVLTDADWFGGSLADLRAARAAVDVPLLRKDFTLHEVQVAEARAAGADAVLLIVRILDRGELTRLLVAAARHGLAALVEVHDEGDLERALEAGAQLIGINNRDLSTFATDLDVTLRLLSSIPDSVAVVSESGIRSRADIELLGDHGVDAVLVGESLLRADDPSAALGGLVGCPKLERSRA